jgi:hypothetical protein
MILSDRYFHLVDYLRVLIEFSRQSKRFAINTRRYSQLKPASGKAIPGAKSEIS